MSYDHFQVDVAARIGRVKNQIGSNGSLGATGALRHVRQPRVQDLWRACVERWKRADDACLGAGHHEVGAAHKKHGRSHDRNAQPL